MASSPKESSEARYRRFWAHVGDSFPDLGAAVSTRQYRESERRLFAEHMAPLEGLRVFKTDLWDEARNTRILNWAAEHGAKAFGADLSYPTARAASSGFAPLRLGATVGDVRWIPVRDGAFDAVYSMGTIEHFDETEQAAGEIYRVLRPGGVAVVGVPNRWDPFLRPLLVAILYRLGLYGYGFEKSYSRRALRAMLERQGFEVVAETGLLFIPGWLRMLDLACHSWARPLSWLTGLAARPFAWLERNSRTLQRHGYLLATVVRKPAR